MIYNQEDEILEELVATSKHPGVLKDIKDENSVIPTIQVELHYSQGVQLGDTVNYTITVENTESSRNAPS